LRKIPLNRDGELSEKKDNLRASSDEDSRDISPTPPLATASRKVSLRDEF
jgi:hypothetical protein